jgi:DNA mismatch repair protein MutS2
MDYDQHSLRVLEYTAVTQMLAERTACALGAERARELMPSPIQAFVAERQQETEEARKLLEQHGPFPLGGIYDIRDSLLRAEVGQSLQPQDFLNLASTLLGASRLKAQKICVVNSSLQQIM